MRLIYFSHSYRNEDAAVVRYFGELVRTAGMLPVLDPPSDSVNAARLQRHLRDSDGMVVVLTRRETGVSPHILFEATLCLHARKPLLVFVEDVLSVDTIPQRVLVSRFSRRWYFRQTRDHRQSLRVFESYLGDEPPPRYQPPASRRTCVVVGSGAFPADVRESTLDIVRDYGYEAVTEQFSDDTQKKSVELSEHLACADVAVVMADSREGADRYLMGALRAAFIPTISFTAAADYQYDPVVPREYQPQPISIADGVAAAETIRSQLELFEQAFVGLEKPEEVTRYVDLLLRAGSPMGEYSRSTRNLFIQEFTMGDQYKVGQAGAVGPHAHAHDMNFQQLWQESAGTIDTAELARDLANLRTHLTSAASEPDHYIDIGEVAAAEKSAQAGDGAGALQHLKRAGAWVWDNAAKIGLGVAMAAARKALGL